MAQFYRINTIAVFFLPTAHWKVSAELVNFQI